MTSRILISLSLSLSVLWLAAQPAAAQFAPADDFFNSGAQLYISNNIPAALERVESGLKTYPEDRKLRQLEQLLKQQQQNQQNQQQQQQQQNQPKQDQQKQQQPQNQQNQSSQPNSEEQKKPEEQKRAEQKKEAQQKQQEQQRQAAQKQDGGKKDKPDEEAAAQAGEMTPEEAKRLLDAQKDSEQLLQMKPDKKNPSRMIKDW